MSGLSKVEQLRQEDTKEKEKSTTKNRPKLKCALSASTISQVRFLHEKLPCDQFAEIFVVLFQNKMNVVSIEKFIQAIWVFWIEKKDAR